MMMMMIVGKMPTQAPAAAGDLGMKRFENQLKIQQLESDALRMRLIDAESSSDRRRHALEQGIDGISFPCVSRGLITRKSYDYLTM